jgi:hypothetical protein
VLLFSVERGGELLLMLMVFVVLGTWLTCEIRGLLLLVLLFSAAQHGGLML